MPEVSSCQFILLRHSKGIHLFYKTLRVKDCQGFDNHHAGLIIELTLLRRSVHYQTKVMKNIVPRTFIAFWQPFWKTIRSRE